MDYTNLILELIAVAPGLITALKNLFESNPQKQGETDAEYAARLKADALAMAAETTQLDNSVSGDGSPTPGTPPTPAS